MGLNEWTFKAALEPLNPQTTRELTDALGRMCCARSEHDIVIGVCGNCEPETHDSMVLATWAKLSNVEP